jgi:hypothetical protein
MSRFLLPPENVAQAFLKSLAFDEDAAYMQRGRPYASDTIDILKARWIEYYSRLGDDPTREDFVILADCSAEFRFRGIDEPMSEVPDDAKRKIDQRIRDNPDPPGVREDIATFMNKLKRPDA